MIERRHEAVKGMVKGVSTKTLLKQTGKQVRASTHRHSIAFMEYDTSTATCVQFA